MKRVWPVSYGGSGTNFLDRALRPNVVDRAWWGEGPCHAAAPIKDAPCDHAVYIYRHPWLAYQSQCDRGLERVNQRKLGHPGEPFSHERFARAQIEQMEQWWKAALEQSMPYPITLVKYEALHRLQSILEVDLGLSMAEPFRPSRRANADDCPPAFYGAQWLWRIMPGILTSTGVKLE